MEYDVFVKEIAPEHLASIRGEYRIAELPQAMPREFCRIVDALQAEGVQPAGGVLAIYHSVTGDRVDVEFGATIRGVFFPQDRERGVNPSMVPGGRVVFTAHVGPYDQLPAAYEAVQGYARVNGLELAGMMWERYLTDPAVEPDLNKHVTEVYWPLAR